MSNLNVGFCEQFCMNCNSWNIFNEHTESQELENFNVNITFFSVLFCFCVWMREIIHFSIPKLENFNGSNVKSFIQMHILFLKVIRKWFYANIKKVSGTASDYKFCEHRATTCFSVDGKKTFYLERLTDRLAEVKS